LDKGLETGKEKIKIAENKFYLNIIVIIFVKTGFPGLFEAFCQTRI
jgi:hypothetical protein